MTAAAPASWNCAPPVVVRVVRDGVVESVHRGLVVVAAPDGTVQAALGDPGETVYPRSALKPFQAVALLEQLEDSGVWPDLDGLAIACASHDGSDEHQIEAARLLAMAGLDESALATPPALPAHLPTLRSQSEPTTLAHNCSGKHAGFLWAQVAAGQSPGAYLDPGSAVQQRVRAVLERLAGVPLSGHGTDGCGAPAWRLPLWGLAVAFARLAEGSDPGLRRVRTAMTTRPDLVGGFACPDTQLMLADPRVVAKRGAEAVFGAGLATATPLGVAVKIIDGGNRAAAPVAAAVLAAAGAQVPPSVRHPVVLGGSQPHGHLEVDAALGALATAP